MPPAQWRPVAMLHKDLLPGMQSLKSLLCALPQSKCCNNPSCVNMAGLSEQQLVAGDSKAHCSGCHSARYCCRNPCQAQHWAQHRPVCKSMAAAAAAAKQTKGSGKT